MSSGNSLSPVFATCRRRRVDADFSGGDISSDAGGCLLLRQAEKQTGLLRAVSEKLGDRRRRKSVRHSVHSILQQRVFGLALGYEDLNDHETIRNDLALQTAAGSDRQLASPSTVGRLERQADYEWLWVVHKVLLERFIASHKKPPRELVLDFDATDDAVHGQQEGRFFHGFYDKYCFLPLYVFCGDHLLTAYLRPSNIDAAKHSGAILKLLVKRLRQAWPKVRIVFRADSGFCRHKMLNWCDRHGIHYVVGIARNQVLERLGATLSTEAAERHADTGKHQKLFGEFRYAAKSWDYERRIVMKAEHGRRGSNPRFVVTNMTASPRHIYAKRYCARGEMENRVKEQQLGLFSDRTSATKWWPNQARVLLSALAYALVSHIRRVALIGTSLAKAQVWIIRVRLFKIGAVIMRNTRRIRIMLASGFPLKDEFWMAAKRLAT